MFIYKFLAIYIDFLTQAQVIFRSVEFLLSGKPPEPNQAVNVAGVVAGVGLASDGGKSDLATDGHLDKWTDGGNWLFA